MPSKQAPTSDQLRTDIDRGRPGDEVDFPDPAAAPLGADDEAGGAPPTPAERSLAFRGELTHGAVNVRRSGRNFLPPVAALAAVLLAVLAVFWLLWRR